MAKRRSDKAPRRTGSSRQGRQRYASQRRIPWIPVVAVVAALVVAFVIFRQLEIGAPGERILVGGVGQHVPEGQAVAYTAIPAGTFVLAAWGWKQSFTAYDDAGVRAFLDAHMDKCCESVP